MKLCRRFERFAANLVHCLNSRSEWVMQGKFANQRPVKMASKISGLDLLFFYFVFLRYLKFTCIKSNKSKFTVCMFYYIALHFQDNRKLKFSHFNLVRIKIKDFPNISLNRCLIIFLAIKIRFVESTFCLIYTPWLFIQ